MLSRIISFAMAGLFASLGMLFAFITFALMLRSLLICWVLLLPLSSVFTQITLTGRIVDEFSQEPLSGVQVKSAFPDEVMTDASGQFSIKHADEENISLTISLNADVMEYKNYESKGQAHDLGTILFHVTTESSTDRELPSLTLDEEEQTSSHISGLLQSAEEPFARITGYTFSPARFSRRGLDDIYSEEYLNNLPVNDLESGGVYYSNWSGLNDVTRQDEEVVGANIAEWGFGGVSNSVNTDLRASVQWRQKRISYAVTNRNYRNRIMATWSTGLRPSGWALSLSASRRWAQEGYIPGTYYDGWAYFASVEKKINDRHSINLVVMGSPYERGGNSTATQEMYGLAGDHYYNAYWGYQQGEKRNSRIYSGHQPIFMLRHDWTISDKLSLTTVLGYQTGRSSTKALDWLFANDPRPDYYRRLPSYVDNADVAGQIRAAFKENPDLLQIQWNQLYQINLNNEFTVEDADGIPGNTITGALSEYIMEERRSDIDKKTANLVLQYLVGKRSAVHIGATGILQDTRNYKVVDDLLGGAFYLDWDKYADQDFPGDVNALQNDLLRPNRLLKEGDQFGYDYNSRIRQYSGWISYTADLPKWEVGLAGAIKDHQYWRDGKTQNGKFPDHSLGASDKHDFVLPSGKALLRYKIDGRNYVTLLGMYSEIAPTFRNAFVSPRTRDNVVDNLTSEKVAEGEIRYDLRAPYLNISLSGFYITSKDGIESTSFYHDDLRTFVNFSLTGVDKKYSGVEAAVRYTLSPRFTVSGAASVGEYIYTNRPKATVTQDNDGSVLQKNITIYARNLYVGGTPQSAYTAGFSYRSRKFWTLYVNINRFEENWIEFNPLRRTNAAVDLVEPGSDQWNGILRQEKTDPAWTVDLSFYKSWLIQRQGHRYYLTLNIGITNLLNNEDYINGGFEQYRYDFQNKDINTFPTKYSYMQGLNYFVQGGLRF